MKYKQMKNKIIHIIIITIFSFILIFPSIQGNFKLIKEPLLGGYVPEKKIPKLNSKTFFSEKYQKKAEQYAKYKYGYRAYFIRLYNQYKFSLYKKMNLREGLVYGKNGYLFGQYYIDSHFGKDFIGKDSINKKIEKLKLIKDTLEKENKHILTIIASSKGTFFEEYIPDKFKKNKTLSNYQYYVKKFKEENINFIDFNSYFLKIKGKKEYPLYPKYGVHWSIYGGTIVADSLISYIENQLKIDLPDVINEKFEIKKGSSRDIDTENSLNLFFKLDDVDYAYPTVQYDKKNKDTLTVLVVGDSFFYSINNQNLLSNEFYDSEFWYYNKGGTERLPYNRKKDLIKLRTKMIKFNYIILISNEAKLHSFAWNFIEDLYNMYYSDY